jgi:hypothetical protein
MFAPARVLIGASSPWLVVIALLGPDGRGNLEHGALTMSTNKIFCS